MDNFNFHMSNGFYRQKKEMEETTNKIYEQRQEQIRREEENNEAIKNISELISTIEKSNKGNERLSKRMLWLTIATVFLAAVQIIIAIIGLIN